MKDIMAKKDKTNAMRLLDAKKIRYKEHFYDAGKSGAHYVFDVPVEKELDLKKAASYVGEKSVEMVKSKELLGLTGYIHGGCSPLGMKKFFTTTFHKTAKDFDTILVSGGKIGFQIELTPGDLEKAISFTYADIIK